MASSLNNPTGHHASSSSLSSLVLVFTQLESGLTGLETLVKSGGWQVLAGFFVPAGIVFTAYGVIDDRLHQLLKFAKEVGVLRPRAAESDREPLNGASNGSVNGITRVNREDGPDTRGA